MKGRDEAEEVEQSCSARAAEFPGIVGPDSYWNLEHQTGSGRRPAQPESRQLRRDGRASRGQGLKILAREAKNIAAQHVPTSRTKWSWDCKTPEVALVGTSVSAGALVFLRVPQPAARSFWTDLSSWDGSPARRTSALAACMATHERARPALI